MGGPAFPDAATGQLKALRGTWPARIRSLRSRSGTRLDYTAGKSGSRFLLHPPLQTEVIPPCSGWRVQYETGRQRPEGARYVKFFRLLIFAAGVPLLGLLIYNIGPHTLWHEFTILGWALVPLILLEGAANLFHSQGFRHCLSTSHRSLSFGRVLSVVMAGSSINRLTPTAGLGGEVAKGLLLASDRMGAQAASAVLVDKLSCALSQLVLIAFGCSLLLSKFAMPHALWSGLILVTSALGSGIIGFLVIQRYGKLGGIVRWAVRHRLGGMGLGKMAGSMTELDEQLRRFHRERSLDFILSVAWHFAGYLWGAVPTYYFLILTRDSASLSTAGALTILGIWFDLALFAMPSDIGIQEATRLLAFRIVGYPSAFGLTYGITRRIQQLFWAGIGLVLYGLLVSGHIAFFCRRPRPGPGEGGEIDTFHGGSL
jgi:hypothetical protein